MAAATVARLTRAGRRRLGTRPRLTVRRVELSGLFDNGPAWNTVPPASRMAASAATLSQRASIAASRFVFPDTVSGFPLRKAPSPAPRSPDWLQGACDQ